MMLQDLREHAQGWIAVVIVAILCLAFALWGVEYYLEGNHNNNAIAKVNGVTITQGQFDNSYQRLRQQQLQTGVATLSQQEQKAAKAQVLQKMINQTVLAEAATDNGYQISPTQLDAIVMQIPVFQINGIFSPERFQQALENLSYTQSDFLQNLQQNMLIIQVQSGMSDTEFALPYEINQTISLTDQKRDLGYFIIPAKRFLNTSQISLEAINAYYTAHKNSFAVPEEVSVQYIALSAQQLAAKNQITTADIQQYYQNNLSAYTTSEEWQLARILIKIPANADQKQTSAAITRINEIAKQLQAGADFAQLAKQNSEDNATANNGGVMNWLNRSQGEPVMVQVASSLQPGQISAPFKTNEGFNIVKLLSIKKPQVTPLASVQDKIVKQLQQQKIDNTFSDASDKLSNLTYTNPDTLEVAASALGLPINTTPFFTQKGAQEGLLANPKFIQAAFSDNIKEGNNSDPIQINDGTLAVLRLKQLKPATVKPLTDVKNIVQQILQNQAAQKQAQILGQSILAELQKGTAPQAVAKKYNITWLYQPAASRQASGIDGQILLTAFNLPQSTTATKPVFSGLRLPTGDYVVISVNNVKNGVINLANTQQHNVTKNSLITNLSQLEYDLYTKQKMQTAKIKIEQTN
jgi:peptidyl-prolyl cis-trans isomerase D